MFYENRLGIKKSVISLFTCFVRISARNSVNRYHSNHVIPHREYIHKQWIVVHVVLRPSECQVINSIFSEASVPCKGKCRLTIPGYRSLLIRFIIFSLGHLLLR